MEKVLRSISTYKNFLGEEFKIVLKLDVTELDNMKVLATLKPSIEMTIEGKATYLYVQTFKNLSKEITKSQISQFKTALNLDENLDMYEAVKTVELETTKQIIEADKTLEVNGTYLKANDFEIVTIG